jgi:predicted nucleic acid-binding protein
MVEQERTDYAHREGLHEAALIKAKAWKQGSILELTDCLIAAVAARRGLPLVRGTQKIFKLFRERGRVW